jgi:hypothetical protein
MSNKQLFIMLVIAFLIVGLLRFGWAEFVYHDKRCVIAECRIVKP